MQNLILAVHIFACIGMTIVIMLQKSEGGALGIGGGGGGIMTGRSAAGALMRMTMVFGAVFFITSLGLTTLANRTADNRTLLERTVDKTDPDASAGEIRDLLDPSLPLLGNPVDETPENSVDVPSLEDSTITEIPSEAVEEQTEPVDKPL